MSTKFNFAGYATKYNIKCSDERTIRDNAFKDDDGTTVPLVWNHNHNDPTNVLGHALLKHKSDGVYVYCNFNNTPKAQHAKEMVKNGDIRSLSIFANHLKQNGHDVVHGHIREVSLVLAGANPGAYIDTVIEHSETQDEEAVIYHPDDDIVLDVELDELAHSEEHDKEVPKVDKTENEQKEQQEQKEQKEQSSEKGKTVNDVVDAMTEEQKTAVYWLIDAAYNKGKEEGNKPKEDNMKQNAFDNAPDNSVNEGETLTHAEYLEIFDDAKKSGSLKDAFLAHSITNIENLFPDAKAVTSKPGIINGDDTWVNVIINGVGMSPFQKVKSLDFDISKDEARARGWLKDNTRAKIEQTMLALKRETDGQMVYTRQSLKRDDYIDLQDFDAVVLMKDVMRMKLSEEVARAILVGDGRDSLAEDKIQENHIRPIVGDNDTYTITYKVGSSTSTALEVAEALPDAAVMAMIDYKGSGNITAFIRTDIVSRMLLLKDLNKRRIYNNINELATAMMVNRICRVPANVMGDTYAIFIDLKDYNVGRNPKGNATFFDDFDINFNKMEYLLEQKCSGANVKPYSALVFTKGDAATGNTTTGNTTTEH